MNDTIRLFVAVPLPAPLTEYLVQARQEYNDPCTRLVPEQNLHLTLFFIGNVPVWELESIRQKLAEVAQRHKSFTLTLEKLEPGPKPKAPRLIWARFRQQQNFEDLSRELTHVLSATPPKQEKFIPHVTLARFRKDTPAPRQLPTLPPSVEVLFPVKSLALWKSTLASPHPEYTVLEEFQLGQE